MTFSGVGSCAASAVDTCSKWTPWIDGILSGFTPSALAVLTCTLTHMDDGEAVDTFMPWVLLRLRPAVKDLFPIDTVHLMAALLANFSKAASLAAESSNHPQWLATHSNCNLLHVVYDTCRGLFLQMYGEEDQKSSGDGANRPCRKDWSPKTRASVASVPSRHFAEILVALCRAGVRDEAVAKACAGRVTPRCCMMLPIAQLVDVTLALCFHFHPRSLDMEETNLVGDVGVMEAGEGVPLPVKSQPTSGRCDTDVAQEATQCKKLLPPALNALWGRVEELRPSQVDALVRCLRHYYGEKVDVDFLSRLQKHTAVIKGMKGDTQQQQSEEQSSGGCTTVSDAAKSPGAATKKEPEAMGSQYQLSAEDLFTC
ncbi:unnamed protein product [Trypanosoma congolense IL3000]|uniref:WGS project CAEQ00000000 data, annotated contig 2310 n=1 Tax=Trypanosoma congolense (strain IL3000) TaxID=1068625 RepID=F9WD21_TRYCI|nr:unnamed protein product [Trypanosoma congolense IL3000]